MELNLTLSKNIIGVLCLRVLEDYFNLFFFSLSMVNLAQSFSYGLALRQVMLGLKHRRTLGLVEFYQIRIEPKIKSHFQSSSDIAKIN